MSKVSFRARQIDFNKPLPIIRHDSEFLAEISENALVSRGVPSIPSGMEKEEENEHHFVEVIQALQSKKTSDAYIPVPDIQEDQQRYFQLYPKGFVLPSQFIHIRTAVFADDEPVEYDMDSEDEKWLKSSGLDITSDKFEAMIDKLERGCGQKVMNLEEAKYLLQDDQSLAIAIYDYWLTKRVHCRQPLLLSIKQEKRDGNINNNSDPYVAFRRRTERMQTRKNRKNDENSYEKMLVLREQMEALDEILGNLVRREEVKEDLIANERDLFQIRCRISDYDGSSIIDAENAVSKFVHPSLSSLKSARISPESPKKRSAKKRKNQWTKGEQLKLSSSEELSEDDTSPQNEFAFIRLPGVKYQRPLGRLTDLRQEDRVPPISMRYNLTTVPFIEHPTRHIYTGFIRRRMGRGGRVILDRISSQEAGLSTSYLDAYDDDLSCYDHGDYNDVIRPINNIKQYESELDERERIKASLPFTHLRFDGTRSDWYLHTNLPEHDILSFDRYGDDKVNLTRSKFDDRPEENVPSTSTNNQLYVSTLSSNNIVRRTITLQNSASRLTNGTVTPKMVNNIKPVNGPMGKNSPLTARLLNGVSNSLKNVPAKKSPSSHTQSNGTSSNNSERGSSNNNSTVFTSSSASTNTARAC